MSAGREELHLRLFYCATERISDLLLDGIIAIAYYCCIGAGSSGLQVVSVSVLGLGAAAGFSLPGGWPPRLF